MKILDKLINKYVQNPSLDIYYRLENLKNGDVINSSGFIPAKSPVRNFYNFDTFMFGVSHDDVNFGDGFLNYKTTGGAIVSSALSQGLYYNNSSWDAFNSPAGNISYGIVTGSNNLAWDIDQFALQTIINHGAGGGQLDYKATGRIAQVYDGPTRMWQTLWRRQLQNLSGGNVTIREIGIYARANTAVSYAMIIRDVIADWVIANNQMVNVDYLFKATFPA